MYHTMRVVMDAVKFLNPKQIPLDSFDKKMFIMMSALHIEITIVRILGQWLDGSGWIEFFVQAIVTSQDRAESFLTASHVTSGRYAHQVLVKCI